MKRYPRFVICIRNSGYLASLELRKLYEVVEDAEAEKDDMIRVIDESGEDYLFPSDRFIAAPLPAAVEEAVLLARGRNGGVTPLPEKNA
ncbi:MAG TPA: hypothetical protein VH087_17815 [Thermoanaerobaculia bacterium]|jgi:hypothetical protein|nr:hypothetical protein [Thermoanaerobaculia bacterium]